MHAFHCPSPRRAALHMTLVALAWLCADAAHAQTYTVPNHRHWTVRQYLGYWNAVDSTVTAKVHKIRTPAEPHVPDEEEGLHDTWYVAIAPHVPSAGSQIRPRDFLTVEIELIPTGARFTPVPTYRAGDGVQVSEYVDWWRGRDSTVTALIASSWGYREYDPYEVMPIGPFGGFGVDGNHPAWPAQSQVYSGSTVGVILVGVVILELWQLVALLIGIVLLATAGSRFVLKRTWKARA